jgi:hypothetical protein
MSIIGPTYAALKKARVFSARKHFKLIITVNKMKEQKRRKVKID